MSDPLVDPVTGGRVGRSMAAARHAVGRAAGAVHYAIVYGRPHGYLRAAGSVLLDRRMGVETSGVVRRAQLGFERDEDLHYEPSPWLSLRRILRPGDVSPEDVFLDIGSGKGRVLLEAARYPFRRVLGVELSPHLNEIAERNIARHARHLRAPVEVHTADAAEYEIPSDVTVIYTYNPVIGGLFRKAVANLVASADRHPRTLRLICRALAEEEEAALAATGRFRLQEMALAPRPSLKWARRAALRLYVLDPTEDSLRS